jgi:hypothetical protein
MLLRSSAHLIGLGFRPAVFLQGGAALLNNHSRNPSVNFDVDQLKTTERFKLGVGGRA